ncbi:MAG: hypothetical protein NC339_02165 [Muribaculaceae bacterium]|nr:hypothetical protein [Muribaculaceae bacterium]
MKWIVAIILSLSALYLGSCSSETPRQQRPAPPPTEDDGERPGVSPGIDRDKELSDDVWRYCGGALTLRYDRGGVLFTSTEEGVEIVDLDGADSISVSRLQPGPDSVCSHASVNINGLNLSLIYIKLLQQSARSQWYEVMASDSTMHVLVIPAAS